MSPAAIGLTIAEGKMILESLQKGIVAAQVEHDCASRKACLKCELCSVLKVITTLCCGPFTAMCPCAFDASGDARVPLIPQVDQ